MEKLFSMFHVGTPGKYLSLLITSGNPNENSGTSAAGLHLIVFSVEAAGNFPHQRGSDGVVQGLQKNQWQCESGKSASSATSKDSPVERHEGKERTKSGSSGPFLGSITMCETV